jgi:hypothetical protein
MASYLLNFSYLYPYLCIHIPIVLLRSSFSPPATCSTIPKYPVKHFVTPPTPNLCFLTPQCGVPHVGQIPSWMFLLNQLSQVFVPSCKIWGSHGCDYEECLLGYKNPVRTSQDTHYLSAKESSQLMLCKIWGFHGGDYEVCRLLGYKNPVNTSQDTHYFSATEHSRSMICKIWGFHGGD